MVALDILIGSLFEWGWWELTAEGLCVKNESADIIFDDEMMADSMVLGVNSLSHGVLHLGVLVWRLRFTWAVSKSLHEDLKGSFFEEEEIFVSSEK